MNITKVIDEKLGKINRIAPDEKTLEEEFQDYLRGLELSGITDEVKDVFRHGYMSGFLNAKKKFIDSISESHKDSLDERITL